MVPSTNGHGPRRAILYARVSTDEQARSGYSLAQQIEALRDYAAREGYEVTEEVSDPGPERASLERPGMDRVRDLVAAGGVSWCSPKTGTASPASPPTIYLLRASSTSTAQIRALNDRGDDSRRGAHRRASSTSSPVRAGEDRREDPAGRSSVGPGGEDDRGAAARTTGSSSTRPRRFTRSTRTPCPSCGASSAWRERKGAPCTVSSGLSIGKASRLLAGVSIGIGGPSSPFIIDDVYKPHTFEEVKKLVSPEVAARLDPDRRYGVWWYNRQRVKWSQVAEEGPEGRIYRKRGRYSIKDKSEWIAVPVPDAGIPREEVEAARKAVLGHRPTSKAAGRFWELSGSIMRCAVCGRAMNPQKTSYTKRSGEKGHVYYYRCPRAYGYDGECPHRKNHRADKLEPAVWDLVSGLLKDRERLREGLERMIAEEREGVRGDPEQEAGAWLKKLAEADRKRSGFQDMAAEGLITFDELRAKLADLDNTRELARRELEAIEGCRARLRDLERNADALLEHYTAMVPEALDGLEPEERHRIYKMLRLAVRVRPSGILEVGGVLGGEGGLGGWEPTPASGASTSASASWTASCARSSKSAPGCRGTRSSNTSTGTATSRTSSHAT
jgi:site-specific DNA recombinase